MHLTYYLLLLITYKQNHHTSTQNPLFHSVTFLNPISLASYEKEEKKNKGVDPINKTNPFLPFLSHCSINVDLNRSFVITLVGKVFKRLRLALISITRLCYHIWSNVFERLRQTLIKYVWTVETHVESSYQQRGPRSKLLKNPTILIWTTLATYF